jgi:hypothetical protein
MTSKTKAIGRAALARATINSLERQILAGVEMTTDAGLTGAAEKLDEAHGLVTTAHDLLTEVAALIAAHFNEDPVAFSGGDADDKTPPPPPGDGKP